MLPLLLTIGVLAAAPAQVKLAAPTLTGPGMQADELTFFTDHLAQQLGFQGLRVITSSEIQQLLGFERQKQLMGCTDTSASCQAELANALGVNALVTGSIAKFGKIVQINLKIIKAEDGTPLAAYSGRASDAEGVLDRLTEAAAVLAKNLLQALGKSPVVVKPPEEKKDVVVDVPKADPAQTTVTAVDPNVGAGTQSTGPTEVKTTGSGLRSYAWMPAVGGGALAAIGGVLVWQGSTYVQRINEARTFTAAQAAHGTGSMLAGTGYTMLGVGAAALLAGGGMYLFGGTTQVAVVPGPTPAAVVSGTFNLGEME